MQKKISLIKQSLDCVVEIPGSKSISNRALLLAALASGESTLHGLLVCDDTQAMMDALQALGIGMQHDVEQATCVVQGCSGRFPQQAAEIFCQDSGLVVRFLLAACASQVGRYQFNGSDRLSERPLGDLLAVLTEQGADVDADALPLILSANGLAGGAMKVAGSVSSQFLSALLLAAPMMKQAVTFNVECLISQPYVDMTVAMMRYFGVSVTDRYQVVAGQFYRACIYDIEPDLSGASYFFAAAAVTGGKISVPNINREQCLQGDVAFLSVLENMGCHISQNEDVVTVQGPSQLSGITVDMGDISDTMMTLAAMAPFAVTPTHITNIANTRVKESDRIAAMAANLQQAGIRVEEGADYLTIYPGVPQACVLDSYNDHRIAMACSLLGLRTPGIIINGAECVAKTFPDFFERWAGMCIV